ncbi:hypothetical protein [Streptomyces canus]|uniref:hypothetical protein n=1 Tax=Streptomyces canus TaxID=58343 RepID=UPI003CEE4A0A
MRRFWYAVAGPAKPTTPVTADRHGRDRGTPATGARLRAATGQAEATVRRRPERLRSTGVPYPAVEYDHEPLRQGVEALRRLTAAPRALVATTGRALTARPEVRFTAAATTGRADLALQTPRRTTDDLYTLYTLVDEKIGALGDVHSAETVVTLRRSSRRPAKDFEVGAHPGRGHASERGGLDSGSPDGARR